MTALRAVVNRLVEFTEAAPLPIVAWTMTQDLVITAEAGPLLPFSGRLENRHLHWLLDSDDPRVPSNGAHAGAWAGATTTFVQLFRGYWYKANVTPIRVGGRIVGVLGSACFTSEAGAVVDPVTPARRPPSTLTLTARKDDRQSRIRRGDLVSVLLDGRGPRMLGCYGVGIGHLPRLIAEGVVGPVDHPLPPSPACQPDRRAAMRRASDGVRPDLRLLRPGD